MLSMWTKPSGKTGQNWVNLIVKKYAMFVQVMAKFYVSNDQVMTQALSKL